MKFPEHLERVTAKKALFGKTLYGCRVPNSGTARSIVGDIRPIDCPAIIRLAEKAFAGLSPTIRKQMGRTKRSGRTFMIPVLYGLVGHELVCDGTFGAVESERSMCSKCGEFTMRCEPWDSSCGGYTDYRYTCESPTCGHVRWVDGIDS